MKEKSCLVFLRIALAASFLSAVADRFGLWGAPGSSGVSWGNFENFINYTESLNYFLPKAFIPALAWIATLLEIVLGVFLVVGFRLKETAFVSGILLATFFTTMTLANGIKGPLDYSVFTACAASFLLAASYSKVGIK